MRINIPRVHGSTPKEKLVRSLALILVFVAVIWAFMKNNERVVEVLNQASAVYDETGVLTKDEKKMIVSFTGALRDKWGLECRIQVYAGDFVVPHLDDKTMYIGLAPAIDVVELRFPPIVRKALGKEFTESLRTTFLLPSFKDGGWPMAIQEVLVEIIKKLDSLNKENGSE
ncbi:hypothetical protein LF599_16455 [Pseudodesulfovibrio thermohalotolerans]|uniref:hypothetical protein n=1 Tax=Pseudodesulfovibrio thermohalotolerans TaxID=2880651 RepID=UPI002442C1CC|nr:hypothetical protein [Pseudodesulfovibrio thermohalotolerans]WFS62232.1 hypothetical protein LF599_16455 [Pseudodesulfovibrio thermohalotolerans]